TLLSGGQHGMIGIWDAATGKSRHFVQAHRWYVTGVALVPGGSTFVSSGLDGTLRLHDWRTGKEVRRYSVDADQKQQFLELSVSANRKTVTGRVYIAQESNAAAFYSWDLATGKLLGSFPNQGNVEYANLTTDGEHFLGVTYSKGIANDKTVQRDGNAT